MELCYNIPALDMEDAENILSDKFQSNFSSALFVTDLVDLYFHYRSVIWTTVFFLPKMLCIMPLVMYAVLFLTLLCCRAYRFYYEYKGFKFTPNCWEPVRNLIGRFWTAHARFWYGYEIEGYENVPNEGGALIIFYHGALPIDYYYLFANRALQKKHILDCVGDRFLFKIPASDTLTDVIGLQPATAATCVDILNKGNLLCIAPGGVREAFFGDETYPIIWGKRIGFAKVAITAKVPIIPVFTENIREAFFTLRFMRKCLRRLYEITRMPIVPIFGGLPVKLRTIIGEPVQYDPEISAEELAAKVSERIKMLIQKNQRLPGSVTRSVLQRFQHLFKSKKS